MTNSIEQYDIAIIGGGPAGSTLAALLRREGNLRVLVLEKEIFPRDHIGESFAHRVIPVLAESGALSKVLASDCWIKKYGGYYAWDAKAPSATLFDHAGFERDGYYRWSMHVNRAEFDQILLEHAESLGATVYQNAEVVESQRSDVGHVLKLKDGRQFESKFVVDASGRSMSPVASSQKQFLSKYKNVAVWQHFVGGKEAQSADGDWNIFKEKNLSAIGSYAFEDGWMWYIPVPKDVDGKRVHTHSIGLVTYPQYVRKSKVDNANTLLDIAKRVPILGDLVADAKPTGDDVSVATNYSMISEKFCDYDRRWILNGDSAHFVDPLFSSGVAFAMVYASSTAMMLRTTLSDSYSEEQKRGLWDSFGLEWSRFARSYASAIDGWYHGISQAHPTSSYWANRAENPSVERRLKTFNALVDTNISPDLERVAAYADSLRSGVQKSDVLGTKKRVAFRDNIVVLPQLSLGLFAVKDHQQKTHAAMARFWETTNDGAVPEEIPNLFPAPRNAIVVKDPSESSDGINLLFSESPEVISAFEKLGSDGGVNLDALECNGDILESLACAGLLNSVP